MDVTLADVKRTGISDLTVDALLMAEETGHSIRLIATLYPERIFWRFPRVLSPKPIRLSLPAH